MEIYARKSSRDLSPIDYYMIFAYFKLAVIIQQIYVRWKRGQTQDERFAVFGSRVHTLITRTPRSLPGCRESRFIRHSPPGQCETDEKIRRTI